jgi:hypothetical protein
MGIPEIHSTRCVKTASKHDDRRPDHNPETNAQATTHCEACFLNEQHRGCDRGTGQVSIKMRGALGDHNPKKQRNSEPTRLIAAIASKAIVK